MITHHDERAADAVQHLLDDSRITEITLHDFRRIGIESELGGVSNQHSERHARSRQRFACRGTDAPGGARQ